MTSESKLAVFLTAAFIFGLGSSPAADAAPPKDACSLLTPVQVSAWRVRFHVGLTQM